LAIKIKIEKITPLSLIENLQEALRAESFTELEITLVHAVEAGLLPLHHKDPFDRLLVAQARSLNIPILSADRLLDLYGIQRIW
jgi:PIN domain nuclease of toxin-antitoxin system